MRQLTGILLISFLLQLLFTLQSFSQIRFEELSENVRNVYWFEKGQVYSGINTHLAWYFSLSLVYKIFGFSLENGQYFRLALHVLSVYCLYQLLRICFTFRQALIPILAIILSPTLLYFNTFKNQYGVDLEYFPICLYLLSLINLKTKLGWVLSGLLWALAMFAWLSYPTFIYYLLGLLILFIYKTRNLQVGLISTVAFLLPLILLILPISNKQLLWHDPVSGGGLFQGAGAINFDLNLAWQRVWLTLLGFFNLAPSYLYEVKNADFSYILSAVSVVVAALVSTAFFIKKKSYRLVIISIWSVLVFNLLSIAFISSPGELSSVRRATGLIFVSYAFYVLAWLKIFKYSQKSWQTLVLALVLVLLPLHHLIVYPINLVHLSDLSQGRENIWFGPDQNPSQTLNKYTQALTSADLRLELSYQDKNDFSFFYNWIYSSIAASCYWNHLNCQTLYGFDRSQNKFVPLNMDNMNYVVKN